MNVFQLIWEVNGPKLSNTVNNNQNPPEGGPNKAENGQKHAKTPLQSGNSPNYAQRDQKWPKIIQRFGLDDFTTTHDITKGRTWPKMVKNRKKLY